MKITVIPASTQAGKATIEALLKHESQSQIQAIYRDTSKAPAAFVDNGLFKAVQGGLDEGSNLDFGDSDAVFYIPPPTYDENVDSGDFATRGANKVKSALQKSSSVRRLVIFSALGAQHPDSIGILKINHITDQILADSVPEILIVRPGWFQENWVEALATAKQKPAFFETHFTPADHKIPMVSIADISKIISQRLLETGNALPFNPYAFEIHGPQSYSMIDLQAALEQVTGRQPEIKAIPPDELQEVFKQKLPANKAEEVAEMTVAINGEGIIAKDLDEGTENVERGTVELAETLRQLASGELSKVASGAF